MDLWSLIWTTDFGSCPVEKDLGLLNMTQQYAQVTKKASGILACISNCQQEQGNDYAPTLGTGKAAPQILCCPILDPHDRKTIEVLEHVRKITGASEGSGTQVVMNSLRSWNCLA
ncbi:hypothetical protein TURU_003033 [Turdus rufiventris]|nr:hypothetical protein TURU_003033 [Turdus rufiventris]